MPVAEDGLQDAGSEPTEPPSPQAVVKYVNWRLEDIGQVRQLAPTGHCLSCRGGRISRSFVGSAVCNLPHCFGRVTSLRGGFLDSREAIGLYKDYIGDYYRGYEREY